MDKFRMKLFNFAGKQVKQKTFKADGWDSAEEKARKIQQEYEELYLCYTDMSLSVIR